jgi:regulator of protease activity HflC (stomatin/prohibitin superfamily)
LDGIILGLHGDLKLKIRDVKIFYNDVVAGKSPWTVQNLKEFIMSLLHTSFRDIFKKYKAKQVLLEERERVVNLITAKVAEDFMRYGLELETLNILGAKTSEGTETLFKVEKEKSNVSDEIEILKLKKDLEAQKMELEAAKREFYRKEEILDSHMKLEKSKIQTEAEKIEGEVKSDLLEKHSRAAVAGDVRIMETNRDKTLKIAESTSTTDRKNQIIAKIAELKEKLDKFDNLLAEDKISKDTYKTRIERIEKELKELERLS